MTDQNKDKDMEKKYNPSVEPKPNDPKQGQQGQHGQQQPPKKDVQNKEQDGERRSGTR